MALTTNQYALNSTPVIVADQSPSGVQISLHNIDQGTPCFVGANSSVSSVTGFKLDAKDKVQLVLQPSEQLWAVCAAGQTSTLAVIRQTQYGS